FFSLLSALRSTLFPYTTLFRSLHLVVLGRRFPLYRVPEDDSRLVRLPRPLDELLPDLPRPDLPVELHLLVLELQLEIVVPLDSPDRKSTRLNSSHEWISYAVFC